MRATDATATDAPTRRPANRRELILEAAVELFHRHGYPATSVDDIGIFLRGRSLCTGPRPPGKCNVAKLR